MQSRRSSSLGSASEQKTTANLCRLVGTKVSNDQNPCMCFVPRHRRSASLGSGMRIVYSTPSTEGHLVSVSDPVDQSRKGRLSVLFGELYGVAMKSRYSASRPERILMKACSSESVVITS